MAVQISFKTGGHHILAKRCRKKTKRSSGNAFSFPCMHAHIFHILLIKFWRFDARRIQYIRKLCLNKATGYQISSNEVFLNAYTSHTSQTIITFNVGNPTPQLPPGDAFNSISIVMAWGWFVTVDLHGFTMVYHITFHLH